MKKWIVTVLALLLMITLTACTDDNDQNREQPPHEHAFSTTYQTDELSHWYVCECGEIKDQSTHDFAILTEPSTCTVHGLSRSVCSTCGYVLNADELPLADHTFGEWQMTKAVSGTADGEEQRTCTTCGTDEIRTIHNVVTTIIAYPTCEAAGELRTGCTVCNDFTTEPIAKLDHTMLAWEEVSPSTCSQHGTQKRSCAFCSYEETDDAPLTDHDFGEWEESKPATLTECGRMTKTCTVCGAQEHYDTDKLLGYTVTVSGGTVNLAGQSLSQSSIYVAEGTVVSVAANSYSGYTFYQWYSDGGDVIPTASFELRVTRNTNISICFIEPLAYGDWIEETARSCEVDGKYSRTDATTGLKEYLIVPATGHDLMYEGIELLAATCTTHGEAYYPCRHCDYREIYEISSLGHDFSGAEVILEEAYGPKIGKKQLSCTRCDEKLEKNYIKAVYPTGNLAITYDSDNRMGIMSSDRNEDHWMLGKDAYCYHIVRDATGHYGDNYLHFYFYYENKGLHSPVYVKKLRTANLNGTGSQYPQYGSYGWGLATYVDSFDEFLTFIDKGQRSDNGLNATGMYDTFRRWEDIYNEVGGIPNGYYCDGVTEYLGYTCRIWSNGGFYYYVNEDNCCLLMGGLGTNRDNMAVTKIETITELPYGPIVAESVTYTTINIKNGDGNDSSFGDTSYFWIENTLDPVTISEYRYLSSRLKVVGWEVKLENGTWAKIEGLSKIDGVWRFSDSGEATTYKYILDTYFGGKLAEIHIRAITVPADMPVSVTVTGGTIEVGYDNFGAQNVFPANEEIQLCPDDFNVVKWIVTVNGTVTEYPDYYYLDLTLPESGTVTAVCVTRSSDSSEADKCNVTINTVGGGRVNLTSGEYDAYSELLLFANAQPGKRFVGWYVTGLYNFGGGDDIPMMLSLNDEGADYSEYGEFFGDSCRMIFFLEPNGDPIVITAVFEELDTSAAYIDVTITDGFIQRESGRLALEVTALRLDTEEYLFIMVENANSRIIGWTVVEDQDGTDVTTELDGQWSGHYAEYPATISPRYENTQ